MTFSAPDADRFNFDERHLLAQIKVALGGRAAEEVVFGDLTTGAESDIQQLTRIARYMVGRWGMSGAIGPIAVLPQDGMGMLLPGRLRDLRADPAAGRRGGPPDRRDRAPRGASSCCASTAPARRARRRTARARDARRGRCLRAAGLREQSAAGQSAGGRDRPIGDPRRSRSRITLAVHRPAA